ncbi:hypothetical protein SDRG_09096 [Saprolegnia diclina VS20]|uniref:DUF501 domain-containing protein n=1 Tax=Saprolegnia diclina (strain VS20) TaxID=1156394 RepID=T0RLE0_SAPDV|nr:hypothetical protein SDRG_09096 [Saprolegnia diclina VS20]EQC33108.1 hypothetical protein SDRG_09096 [Saprolegnia diclina VS20]|eukprot:XP_008613231.1 hypothetical protein SDRG_09096 [Saprolegnia diclina VS20]
MDEHGVFLSLGDVAQPPAQETPMDTTTFDGVPSKVTDTATLGAIERNLGYVPTNLITVAAFHESDEHGHEPAVLKLYPLRNCMDAYKKHERAYIEPFPTTFWLASTELKEKVSVLEGMGFVDIFTERLTSNPEYLEAMAMAHQSYADLRYGLLTPRDMAIVEAKGWQRALKHVGIAGIRNRASVKCLHTHYAHYLATKTNIVGAWVQEALDDLAVQAA